MMVRAIRNFSFLQQGRVFFVYHGQEYDLSEDEALGFIELGWVELYEDKNLGHPGDNKNAGAKTNHSTRKPSRKPHGNKKLPTR